MSGTFKSSDGPIVSTVTAGGDKVIVSGGRSVSAIHSALVEFARRGDLRTVQTIEVAPDAGAHIGPEQLHDLANEWQVSVTLAADVGPDDAEGGGSRTELA